MPFLLNPEKWKKKNFFFWREKIMIKNSYLKRILIELREEIILKKVLENICNVQYISNSEFLEEGIIIINQIIWDSETISLSQFNWLVKNLKKLEKLERNYNYHLIYNNH